MMSPSAPPHTFASTSRDHPSILTITLSGDSSLGAQLINCDKGADSELFLPGYAIVGRLLPGDTVAKQADVRVGDCIIAVSGHGFRRFQPDYKEEEYVYLNNNGDNNKVELDHHVVAAGDAYDSLMQKIKAAKAAGGDPPLTITLERYGWDARPNSWGRYLAARDNAVPAAMQMIQEHEQWRQTFFPIALQSVGLQKILREKAVSEIDVDWVDDFPPTVYVNYCRLLQLQTDDKVTTDDILAAFVIFTERMLAKAGSDPRHPKTCQFIDLSGISITSSFRVDALKKIYSVFEANYPETLFKMVMFPVSSMMATTARTLLSFVNEKTQKKFVITSSLDTVCGELGWNKAEVEECGGVTEFMHKHEKAGNSMIYD